MIRRLAAVLRPADPADRDAGLSLVEVIVAMMVFAVVSVGVAYSITNSLVLTRESRARAIATNLAAQEIDLLRSVEDVFTVTSKSWSTQVGGFTFHVARTAAWTDAATTSTACGTGVAARPGASTGSLQYKSVRVAVTYDGMRKVAAPITSATVLAPNDRINDPAKGTIVVQVTGASGAGRAGVPVTIGTATPANGAVKPASPPVTDATGCSYALRVEPGNYTVSIAAPGLVTPTQESSASSSPVTVEAGRTASASFSYDTAVSLKAVPVQGTTPRPLLPTNLDITFRNVTRGDTVLPASAASPATLFPFSGGYAVMAGRHIDPTTEANVTRSCLSVDPSAWTTPAADGAVGRELMPVGGLPGASETVDVPMGLVQLTGLRGSTALVAVQQDGRANGDPGCVTGRQYTFEGVTDGKVLALPYGTWKFYRVASILGVLSLTDQVTPQAGAAVTRGVVDAARGTVLLDPRTVAP
ncbi:prepilin-type N-terminal cleavage/methylation domain-containing protein [Frigoribacterium salinisoli]